MEEWEHMRQWSSSNRKLMNASGIIFNVKNDTVRMIYETHCDCIVEKTVTPQQLSYLHSHKCSYLLDFAHETKILSLILLLRGYYTTWCRFLWLFQSWIRFTKFLNLSKSRNSNYQIPRSSHFFKPCRPWALLYVFTLLNNIWTGRLWPLVQIL